MRKEIENKVIKVNRDLELAIYPLSRHSKIFEIDEIEAEKYGEAQIQILESKSYEYELSNDSYQLEADGDVFYNLRSNRGTIKPGNYVGTLELKIKKDDNSVINIFLEVLATKFNSDKDYDKSYRTNYRSMIESITEKCTELLMQANSPVTQYFEPNFNRENKTIYQRFSFIKAILNSIEFSEAIQRIISSPKTNWVNKEEVVDIRSIKRFSNQNVKDLIRGNNRIPLPTNHSLFSKGNLESVQSKINSYRQESSVDTPENRFIKHALQTYLHFFESCKTVFKTDSKDQKEAVGLIKKLESFLNHSFFKTITRPTTLRLNSPTLQRKGGYRQVLKSWLMYDLASKLTWSGGEDVYSSGKRDIATLYEYWLFFVLYDLFKGKFGLNQLEHEDEPYSHLFETTKHGLNLIIKSGKHTALSGNCTIKNRLLNIKFSFNRTFSGNKGSFPAAGSWTTALRPDYTLSVWPSGLKEYRKDNGEREAEQKEQIVHIHFDAKYKVNHFKVKTNQKDKTNITKEEEEKELNKIKREERSGQYKNADLLKMHAYKDAIRRTGGAYILYPGDKETRFKGFHELIPGLGAFSLNPDNEKKDIRNLSNFIDEVISHLINNASQRENIATKKYNVYKDNSPNTIEEPIPESINGEKLIPDETYVLVGYCKSVDQDEWIKKNKLYNFRTGTGSGSKILDEETINSKYLLLHKKDDKTTGNLWKIKSKGPKVYSQNDLIKKGYPNPTKDYYLIIEIEKVTDIEFQGVKWKFKELKNYKERRASAFAFTANLSELMSKVY